LVVGIEERVVKLIGKFSWAIRDGERIFSGYMLGRKVEKELINLSSTRS
jgi:hypothetical protein